MSTTVLNSVLFIQTVHLCSEFCCSFSYQKK